MAKRLTYLYAALSIVPATTIATAVEEIASNKEKYSNFTTIATSTMTRSSSRVVSNDDSSEAADTSSEDKYNDDDYEDETSRRQ